MSAISFSAAAQGVYSAPGYYSSPKSESEGGGFGEPGFTVGADIGGTIGEDFNQSRYGVPGAYTVDPGVRFSIQGGYNFLVTRPFTLEAQFETGFLYNYLPSIRYQGNPFEYNGYLYQVPLLANLVVKFHLGPHIIPYVGIGGGGDVSTTAVRPNYNYYYYYYNYAYETDVDPAVQAMAGLRLRFWGPGEFGVGYKFLEDFSGKGDSLKTHAIFATYSMDF